MATLEGVVAKIIARKESGWSVLTVRYDDSTGRQVHAKIKGNAPRLLPGQAFRADGQWVENTRFKETEFKLKNVTPDLPKTHDDAVTFLATLFSPETHGIGEPQIRQLLKRSGISILEQALDDPELIVSASADPAKKRAAILRDWNETVGLAWAIAHMEKAGLARAVIDRIVEVYREDTFRIITRDPYAVTSLSDVDFETADQLGRHLGLQEQDDRRIASALRQTVSTAIEKSGNTYCSIHDVLAAASKLAGVQQTSVIDFVQKCAREGGRHGLHMEIQGTEISLTDAYLNAAEDTIAQGVANLNAHGRHHAEDTAEKAVQDALREVAGNKIKFDDIQMDAIRKSVRHPAAIITGGPGTGKSAVQSVVARASEILDGQVYLAAPTGTAAVRLNEAVQDAGLNAHAMTVHRLLEGRPAATGIGHIFGRDQANPLPGPCTVIVDEASMLDTAVASALIDALPHNGRVIFVGDQYQLPSVGPGQVLRDLIESETLATTELINVYRQAEDSAIPHGAAMVKKGEYPDEFLRRKPYGGVAFFACDNDDIEKSIETLIVNHFHEKSQSFDVFRDVTVLAPMHKPKSGVQRINERLAKRLNPRYSEDENPGDIRPGDRVMFRDNDVGRDVYNGDTGILLEDDNQNGLKVNMDDGRTVSFTPAQRRNFKLSYALTIHKSQGKQYRAVIMPMSPSHEKMLDRPLLYTGWTRAKDMLLFVGQHETLHKAVDNTASHERMTRLKPRLRQYHHDMAPTNDNTDLRNKSDERLNAAQTEPFDGPDSFTVPAMRP